MIESLSDGLVGGDCRTETIRRRSDDEGEVNLGSSPERHKLEDYFPSDSSKVELNY